MKRPVINKKPDGKCAQHPRYTGKGLPNSACPVCWRMYLALRYDDLLAEAVLAPKVFHMNDRTDIRRFVQDLKAATKNAKDTGGSYSAFARTSEGDTVQIEVWLSGVHTE